MTESVNELKTKVFVEQPLASPGSANYHMIKYTTVIDSGAKSGWTKQNPVC